MTEGRRPRGETEASLALWERETIISFNEEEKTAHIYTHNRGWITHLEKNLKLKPTSKNSHGGRDYELPKKWIYRPHMPKKLDLTEEQKEKLRERLVKARKVQSMQKSATEKSSKVSSKKSRTRTTAKINSKV